MNQNQSSKPASYAELLSAFAAGLLIGIFATAAWFTDARLPAFFPSGTAHAPMHAADSSYPQLVSTAVAVMSQSAGDTVMVAKVDVPAPGVWVAVEEYQDGMLGNVLGAQRVTAPLDNVTVSLLRNTIPGAEYAVVLYRDNGDGLFDQDTDSVYVDFDTGERVVAPFATTP